MGLTTWQFSELSRAEERYVSGDTRPEDIANLRADGEAAATATNAFGAPAIGMGVAGATLLVIDILRVQTDGPKRTTVAVAPVLAPIHRGMALSIGGRW